MKPHLAVVPNGKSSPVPKKKFTPENIRQISNLVERGKSRNEIAEIIGVTPGTLAVTCSKLGISLRRPHFDIGTRRLWVARVRLQNSNGNEQRGRDDGKTEGGKEIARRPVVGDEKSTLEVEAKPLAAKVTIVVGYRGEERKMELTAGPEVLGRLALEAEFRGLKLRGEGPVFGRASRRALSIGLLARLDQGEEPGQPSDAARENVAAQTPTRSAAQEIPYSQGLPATFPRGRKTRPAHGRAARRAVGAAQAA
jgi:hypothetical protein